MKTTIPVLLSVAVAAACASNQSSATSPTGAQMSALGGACRSDSDCQGGLSCDKDDPGGQCEKACKSTADCGSGAVCEAGENQCHPACQSNSDCGRNGYVCMGQGANRYCDSEREQNEGKE